jgi:hypothetical protein
MRAWECGESNCLYRAKEGASTLMIFITIINELYKRRIASDIMRMRINNLVAIRWVRGWCSLVDGGTDGKKLRLPRYSLILFHKSVVCREMCVILKRNSEKQYL